MGRIRAALWALLLFVCIAAFVLIASLGLDDGDHVASIVGAVVAVLAWLGGMRGRLGRRVPSSGRHEVAGQVTRYLLALDRICRGLDSSLGPAAEQALTSMVAQAIEGSGNREQAAALTAGLRERGLDPRIVVDALPGHAAAVARWGEDDEARATLIRFRRALVKLLGTTAAVPAPVRRFFARRSRRSRPSPILDLVASAFPPPREANVPASETDAEGPTAAVAREMHRLPPRFQYFTGRARLIAAVAERLAQSQAAGQPAVAYLSGQPGVGSSAVAVEIARALRPRFPEGVLYFDLHGLDTGLLVPPQRVARDVLEATGADATTLLTDESLVSACRDILRERRILVVLDNARDADHVAPLLGGPGNSCVIVTCRDRSRHPGTGLAFTVGRLSRGESAELLSLFVRSRTGRLPRGASGLCATLAALCDHVPLALVLVGAQICARPENRTLDVLRDLIRRLESESTRLSHLARGDRSVRAAIALSYELLDETTRRVLKYAHAARNATVTAAELGYCLELDAATAEDGLNRLTDRSLARQDFGSFGDKVLTWYGLFELVRLFAAERRAQEERDEDVAEFTLRHLRYMRDRLAELVRDDADPRLRADPTPLMSALDLARTHPRWRRLTTGFATELAWYLDSIADLRAAEHVDEILAALHREGGEYVDAVRVELRLAERRHAQRRFAEALQTAKAAFALADEQGIDPLTARAAFHVGRYGAADGKWSEASESSVTAAEMFLRQANLEDALHAALNAATFAMVVPDFRTAERWADEAVKLSSRLNLAGERAEATHELGRAELGLGERDAAYDSFLTAGVLYEQMGFMLNAAIAAVNAAAAAELTATKIDCHRLSISRLRQTEPLDSERIALDYLRISALWAADAHFEESAEALDQAIAALAPAATNPRMLLEARIRRLALHRFAELPAPAQPWKPSLADPAAEANLTAEHAALLDGASADAREILHTLVTSDVRNNVTPVDTWWYDQIDHSTTEPASDEPDW